MAQKPETRYRLRVEKHLPASTYKLKLALPYNADGVADSWYSDNNDIWIEWKWIPKLPVRVPLSLVDGADPWLTKAQQEWLEARYSQGRTVGVIAGSPEGGLVLPDLEWKEPIPRSRMLLWAPRDVAAWLTQRLVSLASPR